jgi:integrase
MSGAGEAKRAKVRLDKGSVDDALPEARPYLLWDADLVGFGLKVLPSGVKTYLVHYRIGQGRAGIKKEYTIGRHGTVTPKQARDEAKRVLAEAQLGGNPQGTRARERADITVAKLCELYLADGVATKKATTLVSDRSRIKSHIIPLLGRKPVSKVTSSDVDRFMRDVANGKTAVEQKPTRKALKASGLNGRALKSVPARKRSDSVARGGKGTASRTVGLLGGILQFAVREEIIQVNPVRGVTRFQDKKSQRYLTSEEVARLTAALKAARDAGANPHAFNIIYLLMVTGARRSEIEGLKWTEVDVHHGVIRLDDGKTGARPIPLGEAAVAFLKDLPQAKRSRYVFASARDPDQHYVGTPKVWEAVRVGAGLPDVRMHDLRHTFASFAVGAGISLPFVGALLGHRDLKTTQQYAHLSDQPIKAAATQTAGAIERAMTGIFTPLAAQPPARCSS